MKKLLLLSSLLLVSSLSYSMNNEREKKLQQQDEELDRMLVEAQAMNARAKELSRTSGMPMSQNRQEKNSEVAAKKPGGKLVSLNASSQDFADKARNLRTSKSTVRKKEEKKEELKQQNEMPKNLTAQQTATNMLQKQAALDKRILEDSKRIVDTFDQDFHALRRGKNSNDLNRSTKIYNYVRDTWIVELFFGVRLQTKLNRAFDHELSELEVSLERVEDYLKKSPGDKRLIDQKDLVEKEINLFQKVENRDAFYRSSMRKSEFDLFKQGQAARE